MYDTAAFRPIYSNGTLLNTVNVAATTTSAFSTQLAGNFQANAEVQIRISNQTASWAFVNFGTFGAVIAATVAASFPVAPGSIEIVTVSANASGAAVILSTGTGTVGFTRGHGV